MTNQKTQKADENAMIKEILCNGMTIRYNLQLKNVKNINLRIKSDGSINVSANRRVPQKVIEEFIISKSDFILKALEKYENMSEMPKKQYFGESEIKDVITELCRKAYPYYERLGIKQPQIKFRKMTSRWGSCHPTKGILTFNTELMYTPIECVEYVVWHEFTHFLQANHSQKFYTELEKACPDWRERRKILKSCRT